MDRRSFIATVAATAVAAHLPTPHRMSIAIQDPSGAWALAPDGLVEVRRGQRFRILEPDTGALHFEAIADEDGVATMDVTGRRQGQVMIRLADAKPATRSSRPGGSEAS